MEFNGLIPNVGGRQCRPLLAVSSAVPGSPRPVSRPSNVPLSPLLLSAFSINAADGLAAAYSRSLLFPVVAIFFISLLLLSCGVELTVGYLQPYFIAFEVHHTPS